MGKIVTTIISTFIVLFLLFSIDFENFSDMAFGPGMSDYEFSAGCGYKVFRSSKHNIKIIPASGDHSDGPVIGAKVVQYASDDRYVLAKQVGLKRKYPENVNNTYMIPDESVQNYYILDAREKKLYGPYSLDEFNQKRTEFGISPKLKFKNVK